MSKGDDLSRFVRDALSEGRSRDEIQSALSTAGWSDTEVTNALGAWSEIPFAPPIPRPQATVSAKDFFIYALTFGVLVFGASYLLVLIVNVIDMQFELARSTNKIPAIRWAMAVLMVTTPVYLWLTMSERYKLAKDPSLNRSAIRKWMTYLTLLLASAVFLGDLVVCINALLSGDLKVQFLLKVTAVAIVAGAVFIYYINDIRQSEQV